MKFKQRILQDDDSFFEVTEIANGMFFITTGIKDRSITFTLNPNPELKEALRTLQEAMNIKR